MSSESELLARAQLEALEIIKEAREQARMLQEAAEVRRRRTDEETAEARRAAQTLADNVERSIEALGEVLEELRRHAT